VRLILRELHLARGSKKVAFLVRVSFKGLS
jgi:hypothetical protein